LVDTASFYGGRPNEGAGELRLRREPRFVPTAGHGELMLWLDVPTSKGRKLSGVSYIRSGLNEIH